MVFSSCFLRRLKNNFPFHEETNYMMTSSNRNIFRVTVHLCGEFTGPREVAAKKQPREALMFFFLSAPE